MSENQAAPQPHTGIPAKTPGIVTAALVLSILGFCGITAIIGVILGFVGKKDAKRAGAGVGKANAAIIIGIAWIALAIIGAIVGAVGGGSTTTSTSSETSQSTTEQALEEEVPVTPSGPGIGDPAADGKFSFTVSKVKCGVSEVGGQYLNETAQGQFCLVTMNVQNVGDEAQTFDASNQKATTTSGVTVDASSSASLYANKNADTFLTKINPGNSLKNVVVVYDIAENQKLASLELHDSIFSGGVTVNL